MAFVFVVEDNENISEAVELYLSSAGMEVISFPSASGVLEAARNRVPDIFVLDIMLPDRDGFSLARAIRAEFPDAGIIFLTARVAEADRVRGFEIGADDYIIKPFSNKELLMRINALLRRMGRDSNGETSSLVFCKQGHSLEIDLTLPHVLLDSRQVSLTPAEWKILVFLASHRGQVFSRERILESALDYSYEGSSRTVDTHIKNLRSKLGSDVWIETIRGFGYRFTGDGK
ncbi:response regulator transcription factor [Spirochaetia bacterium 38H-sp]|uniref:Response regulator transcription factor n=1 Tax=Rarispira pelagica TaxID=3141764 RepID=A0ABU9UB29_9SPIR